MSSTVFEHARTKLSRWLRWGAGPLAMALVAAGCGGGEGTSPAAAAPSQRDQVAASAMAEQAVGAQIAAGLPRPVALAAISTGTASDDFENGMAAWQNWGNAQVVAGAGTSGSSAMQVGAGGGGAGLLGPGIVPGTAYRLTAQVRVDNPAEAVNIGVKMLDAFGNALPSAAGLHVDAHAPTDWAPTTVSLVAPANAAYALIWVWKVAGSAPGSVDDVVFGPASAPPPPSPPPSPPPASGNMISSADSSFETGMSDWSNWGNAQVVAGAGTSGSNALQVGTGAGGAALRVPGVVAGTSYRLTAQVKVTNPAEPVRMGVNFYNTSGSQLIGFNGPAATGTAYGTYVFDVVAPASSAYAIVWVWTNAGTGYAYVDDVAFGAPANPPAPPPAPPDTNLVANGGFESGMSGWDNWGNASVVSGQANSGAAALAVGTAAGGAGQDVGVVVPNSVYRLVAHAKVSDPSETVFVGVNFLNQAGTAVQHMALPVKSTSYSTVTFDVRALTDAVRAVVFVWKNDGSGLGYVDDVVFGVAPGSASPPPGNLVVNGGFESGLANWVNWGNAGASPTQPAAGAAAAQVGTGAGGFGQNVGGIVAGNTYRLTAQVQVSTAGEVGYLGVKFLDASGNSLLDRNVTFSSATYSTVQLDATAPANATTAMVYVWKNAGSGYAFVDEVALAQVTGS